MNRNIRKYPYEFTHLEKDEDTALKKYFNGDVTSFLRVGPKRYVVTVDFIKEASNIYNLPLLPGDILVAGFPRSGTTCTQELVWMIANNLNYDEAKRVQLFARYDFLEFTTFFNEKAQERVRRKNLDNEENLQILKTIGIPGTQFLSKRRSPRFIKTHLPFSLLPPDTLTTAKVVYIARDPRAVAVSFFHHNRVFEYINYTGDFKSYWNLFINDLIPWCPYFENLKEAWKLRHHHNMLFLFYEELLKDMPTVIKRVADFLGKELTEEQIGELLEHLTFENFKNNPSVNRIEMDNLEMFISKKSFIRKGKADEWQEYFDEEMRLQAEQWISHNLRNTDFRFPHLNI